MTWKNTRKIIKQAMNIFIKKKTNNTKFKLKSRNIEDPKEIAKIFNSYFSTIVEDLALKKKSPNLISTFQPNANSIFFLSHDQIRNKRYCHFFE